MLPHYRDQIQTLGVGEYNHLQTANTHISPIAPLHADSSSCARSQEHVWPLFSAVFGLLQPGAVLQPLFVFRDLDVFEGLRHAVLEWAFQAGFNLMFLNDRPQDREVL